MTTLEAAWAEIAPPDATQTVKPEKPKGNPCLRLYGQGPENTRCGTCMHLFTHQPGQNRYYKCDQRAVTSGAATDHRVRWPACGRYEDQP